MTQSVYLVGGAGAGKSTFTAELMEEVVYSEGILEDLLSLKNAKALVTLRGHRVWDRKDREGLYLGCLRESFPGTDGLDRASSPVGEAWLKAGDLPEFIISEGATLATRRFIGALAETTDLLVVHLFVDNETREARFAERGSSQNPQFVANTVTRSRNITAFAEAAGASTLEVNTASSDAWSLSLDLVAEHLR